MGEVLSLADCLPGATLRRAAVPAFRRYRLLDLARLLALDAMERRSQITRLRILARIDGLPLPLNPRVRKGVLLRGPQSIDARSEWDAAAFDAWLNRPVPPAPSAACGDTAPPLYASASGENLREALRGNAIRLAAGGR